MRKTTFVAVTLMIELCLSQAGDAQMYWKKNPDHPRLHFCATDIPTLREKVTREPLNTQLERVLQRCADYQEKDLPGGDSNWILGGELRDLAFAYVLTGEGKYAGRAIDLAMTIAHGEGELWKDWMAQPNAPVTHGLALTYDMLHDALSESQRAELATCIHSRLVAAYTTDPPKVAGGTWLKPQFPSNQSALPAYCLGMAALAVYGEIDEPRLNEWIALATEAQVDYMEFQVTPEGAMFEGPGYASGSVQDFIAYAGALRRAGGEDLIEQKREQLQGVVDFLCHCLQPGGGHIVKLGQCFDEMQAALWLGLASALRSPQGMWGWQQFMQPFDPQGRFFSTVGDGLAGVNVMPSADLEFIWYDDSIQSAPPENPVAAFQGMGVVDIRSGWGPGNLRLLINGGTGWCGGCPDKGNFVLDAFGENFAVDIGYGSLPSEEQNCLLIDGRGFPQGNTGQGRARLAEHSLTNPMCRYARIDMTGTHTLNVERLWRHFAVMQAQDSWCVVIGDVVDVGDGNGPTYDWILVTAPGNRFAVEDHGKVRITGKNRALMLQLVGAPDAVFETDVIEQNWVSRFGQRNVGDYPRLRISRQGRVGRFLVLLCPAGRQPEKVVAKFTDEALGAELDWGSFRDTIRFAVTEVGAGEKWWEMNRSTGGAASARPSEPAIQPAAERCPATDLETLLGAGVVYGPVSTPLGLGVQVTETRDGGFAASIGLRANDVILACGEMATPCPKDLLAALQRAEYQSNCTLTVARDGEETRIEFQPISG